MENEKVPSYVWKVVLFFNIPLILFFLFLIFYASSGAALFLTPFFIIIILFSVIPVRLSQSKKKRKNLIGYGIPILMLLPVPYFVYEAHTCSGKLCEIGPILIIYGLFFSSATFAFFYFLAERSKKWSKKKIFFSSLVLVLLFNFLWRLIIYFSESIF